MIKQLPLTLHGARKRELRSQFAALCYQYRKGKLRILLVTSRRTGRWIIPKGWPVDGKTPSECAAIEAWEEGGVHGKAFDWCLGLYSYVKTQDVEDDGLPCVAMVYPVKVKDTATRYPEAHERKRKWVSPRKAAKLVMEPELSRIIRDFDPKALR